jgi:hypothetical protein
MTPDPLTVLGELAACRAAIASLDAREAAHYAELSDKAAHLAGLAATASQALADDTAALTRLDDLGRQVSAISRHLAPNDPAQPPSGPAASGPVAALRDWVERVYRPGYGHLAVLGPCWPQHQLCLHGLDILRQLHAALYLDRGPVPAYGTELLSARAEYQARLLPAIAAQLAAETTSCGHPAVTPYPGASQ